MKIPYFYLILSLLILGGSCSRQVDEQALHCINFQEGSRKFVEPMLSKYFSSLRYTPIETRDSILLGEIGSHFVADDSLMFFVSGQRQKCIHMFSKDGKYIKDIGTKGNGPNEYSAVRTMTLIPEMNALMTESGTDILYYSLENGSCLRKIVLFDLFDSDKDFITNFNGMEYHGYNITLNSTIYLNNHIYTTAGDGITLEQYLVKMRTDFGVDTMIKMRPTSLGTAMPSVLCGNVYAYDDKIHVIHGLHDTIYTWKNGSLVPRIAIDFGNIPSYASMPQIKKKHPVFSPNTRHLNTKIAALIIRFEQIFMETDHFIIGTVFLPKDYVIENNLRPRSHFIYDKITRKTKFLKYSEDEYYASFTNDIDGGMPFWPTKHIGNKLYQFVDAGTFIEMSEKYNSPRMKEIAATLTEDSNPVMIEATLK
jgi:hypothetical protein